MKKKVQVHLVPINVLTAPIVYVGFVFKNKDGVVNIPDTLEDIQKSHQHFGNMPCRLIVTSDDEIKIDDWYYVSFSQRICQYKEKPGQILFRDGLEKIIADTDKSADLPSISMEDKKWWVSAGCPSEVEIEVKVGSIPTDRDTVYESHDKMKEWTKERPAIKNKCVVFVRSVPDSPAPVQTVEDAAYAALDNEASKNTTHGERALFLQGFLQGAKWKENQVSPEDTLNAMIAIMQEYSIIDEGSVVSFHADWIKGYKNNKQ